MQNSKKFVLLLAALLLASLTACGTSAPAAAQPEEPQTAGYVSDGLTLTVPAEYADLVLVEIPEGTEDGMLFSVSEKASVEAAEKLHPDSIGGAGWLFGISRVGEDRLHELLCGDMSGLRVFAQNARGEYYLLNTPTDVRIEREGEITQSDSEQWSALYAWVGDAVPERFIADNGLSACSCSNTALDILLAQIAWAEKTDYTMSALAYGVLSPDGTECASFAEEILSTAVFAYEDGEEIPDGEYLILQDSENDVRFDFFQGGGGVYVRSIHDDYETLYRNTAGTDVAGIVTRWYETLHEQNPAPYHSIAYQTAVDAVLAEYAALDREAMDNFEESEHPELPWYTAVVANPVRNDLYCGFRDFDENGVPELIIAAGTEDFQQPLGIYAFDGSRMVYLFKEHPLGERAYVSYADGLFFVRASGSAFSGLVAVCRIAEDGYGTEIVEVMDYEYDNDGNVTYTTELGNMMPEEILRYDELNGLDVPEEYALFASGDSGAVIGEHRP